MATATENTNPRTERTPIMGFTVFTESPIDVYAPLAPRRITVIGTAATHAEAHELAKRTPRGASIMFTDHFEQRHGAAR